MLDVSERPCPIEGAAIAVGDVHLEEVAGLDRFSQDGSTERHAQWQQPVFESSPDAQQQIASLVEIEAGFFVVSACAGGLGVDAPDQVLDLGRPHWPRSGVDHNTLMPDKTRRGISAKLMRLRADHDQRCPWLPDGKGFHQPSPSLYGPPSSKGRSSSSAGAGNLNRDGGSYGLFRFITVTSSVSE